MPRWIPFSRYCLPMLIFLMGTAHAESELSHEKKLLIDELSIAMGDRSAGQRLADAITAQTRLYIEKMGAHLDEGFLSNYNQALQSAIEEGFISRGGLQQMNHEYWGSNFEITELQELLEFFKTPVAQKWIALAPELQQKTMQAIWELEEIIVDVVVDHVSMVAGIEESDVDKAISEDSTSAQGGLLSEEEAAAVQLKACSEPGSDDLPIHRPPPMYPRVAADYGIEGSVDLKFDVLENGRVQNIRVTSSTVGSLFNRVAINSVSNYLYCDGDKRFGKEIRVRFEMEDDGESVDHTPFAFVDTSDFRDGLKEYLKARARKAYVVADGGGKQWAFYWRHSERSQEAASRNGLSGCEQARKRRNLEAECKVLLEGNGLTAEFQNHEQLSQLLAGLSELDFSATSDYEDMLSSYAVYPHLKALAFTENDNGAFFYGYASGRGSLDDAIERAIGYCEEGKPEHIQNSCSVIRIGDYAVEDIPRLEKMRGLWVGSIKVESITPQPEESLAAELDQSEAGGTAGGTEQPEILTIRLDNCGDYPIVFMRGKDDQIYNRVERLFEVSERAGNIVLTSLDNSEDWSETRIWMFALLNENLAAAQWSRMVHNRQLDLGDEDKQFSTSGIGQLERIESGCAE